MPDGKRYKVTVPEGTTSAQIEAEVSRHHEAATAPTKVTAADWASTLNHSLMGSWADEVQGGLAAAHNVVSHYTGGTPLAPGKAYSQARQQDHDRQQLVARDHPTAHALLSGSGMALSALALPEAALAKGTGFAARVANGALTAGSYGALEGAGQGTGFTERARNAVTGGNGPGPLTLRGKLWQTAGNLLDKAEPQYAKDVRDHVGQVLTAQDPIVVRAHMDAITAQGRKDERHAAFMANVLNKTAKFFGTAVVGHDGDESGMYGPTE